jgi:hypothetical protein
LRFFRRIAFRARANAPSSVKLKPRSSGGKYFLACESNSHFSARVPHPPEIIPRSRTCSRGRSAEVRLCVWEAWLSPPPCHPRLTSPNMRIKNNACDWPYFGYAVGTVARTCVCWNSWALPLRVVPLRTPARGQSGPTSVHVCTGVTGGSAKYAGVGHIGLVGKSLRMSACNCWL